MKNAKKQRKTIEWERLDIPSRKLELLMKYFMKDEHDKGQKCKDLAEAEEIKKRCQGDLYKKGLNDPDNRDGVVSHLEPDILSVRSSRPQEASLQAKLVKVMEFQLSYFKS